MSSAQEATRLERRLALPARLSELKVARAFAEQAADEFGFDDQGRYLFKFAASEAVANAMEHGSPYADGKIRMRVVAEGDCLALYVCDCGGATRKFNGSDFSGERGRGLIFMRKVMDEVELRRAENHTVIRVAKRLA
jgi:anti-sigma regulatory factor (Ser/Thr protein kinase)